MAKTENKTQPTKASVKQFLAKIKNEGRRKDAETLCRLLSSITQKKPVLWGPSIIGFDTCHYKYESGREGDMGAIGFSPRATNLTIYLVDGVSKYKKLLVKLGPHKTGKVCLYLKRLDSLNLNVLEEILRTSYTYAIAHKTNMHRAD